MNPVDTTPTPAEVAAFFERRPAVVGGFRYLQSPFGEAIDVFGTIYSYGPNINSRYPYIPTISIKAKTIHGNFQSFFGSETTVFGERIVREAGASREVKFIELSEKEPSEFVNALNGADFANTVQAPDGQLKLDFSSQFEIYRASGRDAKAIIDAKLAFLQGSTIGLLQTITTYARLYGELLVAGYKFPFRSIGVGGEKPWLQYFGTQAGTITDSDIYNNDGISLTTGQDLAAWRQDIATMEATLRQHFASK